MAQRPPRKSGAILSMRMCTMMKRPQTNGRPSMAAMISSMRKPVGENGTQTA